jgi:hypothetical protein
MKTPRLVRGVFFGLQKLAGTLLARAADRSHALRGNDQKTGLQSVLKMKLLS